jgi:hypothetical protein
MEAKEEKELIRKNDKGQTTLPRFPNKKSCFIFYFKKRNFKILLLNINIFLLILKKTNDFFLEGGSGADQR